MRKPLVLTIIAFVAVLALGGIWWGLFQTHTVTFTKAELQQRIDAKLPHTTKNGVTVSKADLDLSGNKITMTIEASTVKFGSEYKVTGTTTGELRYDSTRGSFYFFPDDLKVMDVQKNGNRVGAKVGAYLDKLAEKSTTLQQHKADLMAEAKELAQSLLTSAAQTVLERIPVYTFPDTFKGNTARMVLQSVTVTDSTIVATLSFWQLTVMVFIWALVALAAIGLFIACLANPDLALVVLLLGSVDVS